MSKKRTWIICGLALALGLLVASCGGGDCDCGDAKNKQLDVGDEAPDFRLQDHTGRYVRLGDYLGKNSVVLSFYPAAFTPVWSEQMPALDADYERFQEADAQVLGISTDQSASNTAWAESLGIEQLPLLSDHWPHGAVAQQYGVLRDQGFAERATFIVDKGGIVRFRHVYDIDELPSNQELFDALADVNGQ